MDIYVVQQGDSIYSIAEKFRIDVERIAVDNGLNYPYNLVVGQTIVITHAETYHTVKQGDTLQGIANTYQVSLNQILRNNPYLMEREFLYPGERLVISYNTVKSISTTGFSYSFIKKEILIKTLPSLTYLSIFNYTTTEKGEIKAYQDDTDIIMLAKEYGTVPLLMLSTLTPQGEANVETAYRILLNEEYQKENINNTIRIMKEKGYYGVNIVINYLNEDNQLLYQKFLERISERMEEEGFSFFITINFHELGNERAVDFFKIDFTTISQYVNGMIFIKFRFGSEFGPPGPVSNINEIRLLVNHLSSYVPREKMIIGKPFLGYDWQLPYIAGRSSASSLTTAACYDLAYELSSIIQFDEESMTPYFYYTQLGIENPIQHIVWFIDARSIDVLNELIVEYDLAGSGIWNIMIYNAQLWTIINATFDVVKLL